MSCCSARIHGGIYIWLCAMFSVLSGFDALSQAGNGFWGQVLVCVLSLGIAYVVNYLIKLSIVKKAGSLQGEKGPLVGLVCIGTSEFIYDFSTRLRYDVDDQSCFMMVVWGSLSAILVSYGILFVGRRLNNCDMRFSKQDFLLSWYNMDAYAQKLCVGVDVSIVVSAVLCIILNGLKISLSCFITNLFFIAGLLLTLMFLFRERMIGAFISRFFVEKIGKKIPQNMNSVFQNSFTLHEYFATITGSGVAAIAFIFCSQVQHFSFLYVTVVLLAVFIGFLSLCFVWYLDHMYFINLICRQWRIETIDLLKLREEEDIINYNSILKNRIIQFFIERTSTEWEDLSVISGIAERFRTEWNEKFCPYGKCKYIFEWNVFNRKDVVARYVENLIDRVQLTLFQDKYRKSYENMSDSELQVEVANEMKRNVKINEPTEEVIEKSIADLSSYVDFSCVKPVCYMNLDVRFKGREEKLKIEIKEDGESLLINPNNQGKNVLIVSKNGNLDEITEDTFITLVEGLI